MELLILEGRAGVAAFLSELADGIAAGEVPVGEERLVCSDDMTAVVDPSGSDLAPELSVRVRFAAKKTPVKLLGVERELAHPGG
jgi:hypothetical protein